MQFLGNSLQAECTHLWHGWGEFQGCYHSTPGCSASQSVADLLMWVLTLSTATAETLSPELEHLCSNATDWFLATQFPEVWEGFELYPKFFCLNARKMYLKEAYTQNAALQKCLFHHVPINLRMLLSIFRPWEWDWGIFPATQKFFISTHGNWSNSRHQAETKPDWFFCLSKSPSAPLLQLCIQSPISEYKAGVLWRSPAFLVPAWCRFSLLH